MDDLERKISKLRQLVGSQDKKPISAESDENPNWLFIALLFAVLLVLASMAGWVWLRPFALPLDSGQAIRPAPLKLARNSSSCAGLRFDSAYI